MHPVAEHARCGLFWRSSLLWEWHNYTTCDQTKPCHVRPPALYLLKSKKPLFLEQKPSLVSCGRTEGQCKVYLRKRHASDSAITVMSHCHACAQTFEYDCVRAHKRKQERHTHSRKRIVTFSNIGLFPIRPVSPGDFYRECGR